MGNANTLSNFFKIVLIYRTKLTHKEPSSLSSSEISVLHRVFHSILNVKREKREKGGIVDDRQKRGTFNSDEEIRLLPIHHIRECWCNYLHLTWQYAPRISDVGLVTNVTIPPAVLEVARIKIPNLSTLAFLFQFVCNVLADEVVVTHFNRRIAYNNKGEEYLCDGGSIHQDVTNGQFFVPTVQCKFIQYESTQH